MSLWREEVDQRPCTRAWRKHRGRGILAGRLESKGKILGESLDLYMSFATERETRTAAAWHAWHMLGQFWKAKVDFKFHRLLRWIGYFRFG